MDGRNYELLSTSLHEANEFVQQVLNTRNAMQEQVLVSASWCRRFVRLSTEDCANSGERLPSHVF
jgi:hypothetical protein